MMTKENSTASKVTIGPGPVLAFDWHFAKKITNGPGPVCNFYIQYFETISILPK